VASDRALPREPGLLDRLGPGQFGLIGAAIGVLTYFSLVFTAHARSGSWFDVGSVGNWEVFTASFVGLVGAAALSAESIRIELIPEKYRRGSGIGFKLAVNVVTLLMIGGGLLYLDYVVEYSYKYCGLYTNVPCTIDLASLRYWLYLLGYSSYFIALAILAVVGAEIYRVYRAVKGRR